MNSLSRMLRFRLPGPMAAALVLAMALTVVWAPLAGAGESALRDFSEQSIPDYAGKGKWLIVMFWRSDCHVCNAEASQYVAFHKAHKDRDARMLGVSLDGAAGREAALDFMQVHELPFDNLIGEPDAVAGWFSETTGVPWRGTPTFLIYGPDGKLLAQQAGAVPTSLIEDFIKQQGAAAAHTRTASR